MSNKKEQIYYENFKDAVENSQISIICVGTPNTNEGSLDLSYIYKTAEQIKEKFNFQRSAKDLLITSQLRAAMITNKKIKSVNYNIDTYKKKIYIYGIARDEEERAEVINEAKEILDVEDVIASILLIEDLRVIKK